MSVRPLTRWKSFCQGRGSTKVTTFFLGFHEKVNLSLDRRSEGGHGISSERKAWSVATFWYVYHGLDSHKNSCDPNRMFKTVFHELGRKSSSLIYWCVRENLEDNIGLLRRTEEKYHFVLGWTLAVDGCWQLSPWLKDYSGMCPLCCQI